ncbi:DUF4105 domain-containing protein [Luteolibacter algae]|uniref:DUF4105 domain-containing protein n=1 Tax=Luteolibacter algae TaxID=454151 RepID=A0ABW5D890_9BACT
MNRTRVIFLKIFKCLLAIWIFGLIWFNGPIAGHNLWNPLLAILWLIALILVISKLPAGKAMMSGQLAFFVLPVAVFSLIRPSNHRDWQVSSSRTPYATLTGNLVTVHEIRSFDYDADGNEIPHWSTRTYNLENLVAMDVFMTHWKSDYAGHPLFSFDFGAEGHLAFSIEARLEKDESYQLLSGLYRRYELIYIACEESDAVRARSHYRDNESVHIYRTIASPQQARARFMEFVRTMNQLREKPRFYNILTSNCTTAVRSQMDGGFPMDWRIIANGKLDELLYERNILETAGLSFAQLKERSYLDPLVIGNPGKERYSSRIRDGRPGF